jgi:NADH dehydrogenase FAD-containing subunit
MPVLNGISLDSLSKHMEDITNAKKIAVIGSGPVGVEILGSLVHRFPEKEFHVVCRHEKFMYRAAPKGFHF